jgi:hypothetical protein
MHVSAASVSLGGKTVSSSRRSEEKVVAAAGTGFACMQLKQRDSTRETTRTKNERREVVEEERPEQ